MIERRGQVVDFPGAGRRIVLAPMSACGTCPSSRGCRSWESAFRLRSLDQPELLDWPAELTGPAMAGDELRFRIESRFLTRLAGCLLLIPIIGLVLGAWIGGWLVPGSEMAQLICGALGLWLGLSPAVALNRQAAIRPDSLPLEVQGQRHG